MTNEELDRWLATEVMGWGRNTYYNSDKLTPTWYDKTNWSDWPMPQHSVAPSMPGSDYYECVECGPWQPTRNVSQAVQAAEKALADCRISQWFIGRHVGGMPDHGVVKADGSLVENPRDVPESAPALCRALYRALREDS